MSTYILSQAQKQEAAENLKSMLDMLRWMVTEFTRAELAYGYGTENAWDEAFFLLLSTLKLPHQIDDGLLMAKLLPSEINLILENMATRINERKPVSYIVNEAWFGGLSFYVDQRVIIPRSPFAELLEDELSPWVEAEEVHNILDMCTGSGCIAILAAVAFPEAEVDAVDISSDALAVARMNLEKYEIQDELTLIESDVFNEVPDKKYDLILSNPPYVPTEEYEALPPEYHHEPTRSLESGEDGMDVVHRLLQESAQHLTPTGLLVVEVGDLQEELEAMYPQLPFTWLQCENGGGGIFLLTATELEEAAPIKPADE